MLLRGPTPLEDLAELEKEARQTLHRLRYEQHLRARLGHRFPPLVLEFAGCPKSGKTTTITKIRHFLRRMEFRVVALSEGASKRDFDHVRRDLVAYNTVTLSDAVSELLIAYHSADAPDVILLDRGIFDHLAWVGMLQSRKLVTKREANIKVRYALQEAAIISRLYLFTCTPEVSLTRETSDMLTLEAGTAMNPETLALLYAEYERLAETLAPQYSVHRLDTTEPTPERATAMTVVQDILAHDWFVEPSSAPRP